MASAHFENSLGTFAAALGFDNFPIAWDLAKADFQSDDDVAEFAGWMTQDDGSPE